MPILTAKNVDKTYMHGTTNQFQALKQVNLQINKGEFVTVMGPSGSGKSTLLYNLSGMDRLTAGSVQFNGQELARLSEKALARLRLYEMGFIFQQIHLLNNLSIIDNILLPAFFAKKIPREQVMQQAQTLMEMTGITTLAEHSITEASGGELQRVGICRALINHPEIIFGDEPTGALNSKSASDIINLLAEINAKGTTILLVTHDVKVAAKSERVLYMLDGSIVAEKRLGKYNWHDHNVKVREEILSRWLINMGF